MSPRKASQKRDEIVVFSILSNSSCSECGAELGPGNLLRREDEQAFCLSCADLDHLVFLSSGDAALTRRASKYSTLRAVVVRFSRARKRYERQGILVEEPALERAEHDCLEDADARELARERGALRRAQEDVEYVTAFAKRIGELFPGCPATEQMTIARHACAKSSGRVGRSASAKQLDASSVELAVRAHVRHAHTRYDELLAQGREQLEARAAIASEVEAAVDDWRRNARPTGRGS